MISETRFHINSQICLFKRTINYDTTTRNSISFFFGGELVNPVNFATGEARRIDELETLTDRAEFSKVCLNLLELNDKQRSQYYMTFLKVLYLMCTEPREV